MANMIDSQQTEYYGEELTWECFSKNLPSNCVVYFNRTVNTYVYDFLVMIPNECLFLVEVKGWFRHYIVEVLNKSTIILTDEAEGKAKKGNPKTQAQGYRYGLIGYIEKEKGLRPLVLPVVCYPQMSEEEYRDAGLNIISEPCETLFKEDLQDASKLSAKFKSLYDLHKGTAHDELDTKNFAILRSLFEPNYDLKLIKEELNPGYSRLRVIREQLSEEKLKEIVQEYFIGIKEVVFVSSRNELLRIIDELEENFNRRNITPVGSDIKLGECKINRDKIGNTFSIFNFEIEVIHELDNLVKNNILIEEGDCDTDQKDLLNKLSLQSEFNYNQYKIEHLPCYRNIIVTAGAGTGKTYSMVSRIAFLCNNALNPVVDIVKEIAMITFTNDAADNMNRRVKRMFMNYFTLTSKEKYMHFIEDMSQIQISTIHKFAISILQKNCIHFGIGYDSQITSETYNRKKIYHKYFDQWLRSKIEEDEDFVHQLPMEVYKLENILMEFNTKLLDRSVDIKSFSVSEIGESPDAIPYFKELISDVIIKAETEYAELLKENNQIGLKECMIQINELVKKETLNNVGLEYKYVFIDEFQDTDDVQIETISELKKIFGPKCSLFIVGDLKQSIYRFRGATSSAFDKIMHDMEIHGWLEESLNRNYRSDKTLLEELHKVFLKINEDGYLLYEKEDDYLKGNLIKDCDVERIKQVNYTSKIDGDFYNKFFAELKKQVQTLRNLAEQKKNLSPEEKTIAILVRYNSQIADIIRESQKREDLDFSIKVTTGGDLYRLDSTMDLYRLILAITNPTNKANLANLIHSNYVSLHLNTAQISGCDESKKTDELIRILDEYFELYMGKSWNDLVLDFEKRPVLVVLREIYEVTKPWCHYKEKDTQREYRENYDCLIEKILYKYSREYLTVTKISEFLNINITTYQEAESRKSEGDNAEVQVICSTIHKSKGLEYGTVIVPFTSENIQSINIGKLIVAVNDDRNIQYGIKIGGQMRFSDGFDMDLEADEKASEESRILYVALTRTIRNLVWLNEIECSTAVAVTWKKYLEVNE